MSWIAFGAWIGVTSIFLADGPMLVAALGDRLSAGARQLYLAVPLLFGPLLLLLTPWRPWVALGLLAAALLHLVGHSAWVWSLRLRSAPPQLQAEVRELAARWGTEAPDAVMLGSVGPAVIGLRRRILVLPPAALGLPGADLEAVLAHELAHVGARDSLRLWLAAILRSLLCWHPLARFSLDALRLQLELQADRQAAAWLGDTRRYALALGRWGLLLAAAGRGTPVWGAALAERPAELTVRLQSLLEPGAVARELRLPPRLATLFERNQRTPRRPRLARAAPHLAVWITGAGYLAVFLLALRYGS